MATLIKHINRVYAARAFLQNVMDDVGDTLYIGIGRNADTPWPNELAPPVPLNTKADDNAFWATLIGIAKVSNVQETFLCVPKVKWTSGTIYKPNGPTDLNVDKSDISDGNQFYCINNVDKVYMCVAGTGAAAGQEPLHGSGEFTGADGYTWKYMYTASAIGDWDTLNTLNWMPVGDDPVAGFDDPAIALGANYIMAGLVLLDYAGTGNKIPDEEYRQIALLKNPLLKAGGGQCTADYYAPIDLESVGGVISDGILLGLDNRVKITRAEGQQETVVSVLKF